MIHHRGDECYLDSAEDLYLENIASIPFQDYIKMAKKLDINICIDTAHTTGSGTSIQELMDDEFVRKM